MNDYTLQIGEEVERDLRHCRSPIRASIQKRLDELLASANAKPPGASPSATQGPPQRFYVYEGYRVSYQVNPSTRSIVVLKIKTEPS